MLKDLFTIIDKYFKSLFKSKSVDVQELVKIESFGNFVILSSNHQQLLNDAVEKLFGNGYILRRVKLDSQKENQIRFGRGPGISHDKLIRCYQIISIAAPLYLN